MGYFWAPIPPFFEDAWAILGISGLHFLTMLGLFWAFLVSPVFEDAWAILGISGLQTSIFWGYLGFFGPPDLHFLRMLGLFDGFVGGLGPLSIHTQDPI